MSIEVGIILFGLVIVFFLIGKWFVKRFNIGNPNQRNWFALGFAVVVSPIIYVAIVALIFLYISYYPSRDFDAQRWEENIHKRYEMSEDIIESEMLIGNTQEEVIQLLGNDHASRNEQRLSYELGHVPGLFNIDPDFLDITFDDGIVTHVKQTKG